MENNFYNHRCVLTEKPVYRRNLGATLVIGVIVSALFFLLPESAQCQLNLNPSPAKVQDTSKNNRQQATFNKKYFQFVDCEIGGIIRELGKWYRIKVAFEDGSPVKSRLTATGIPKRWSLEKIVGVFVRTGDIRLRLETDCLTLLK